MTSRTPPLLHLSLLALAALGCGGARSGGTSTPTDEATSSSAPTAANPAGGVGSDPLALPSLPTVAADPAVARPVPTVATLEDAARALDEGFYEAVAEALPRLAASDGSGAARLLEARLALATGRYDEAVSAARRAAERAPSRLAGRILEAEALLARGRLEDAERLLVEAGREPAAHRARLLLARLHARRGRLVEAEPLFMTLVEAYNDGSIASTDAEGLTLVALAAVGLGSPQDANDAFAEATRAEPQRLETQLEWARLFLDKYDTGHAEESLQTVLARNPRHAEGLALMARVKIEQSYDFAGAEELLDRALAVNPRLVEAWVVRAGIALRDLDIATADAHLDRALAIDPNDLEALSVRAATRFLADDREGFTRAKAEVLRRHRTYARLYDVVGDFGDWEHRYPDLVQMGREAVALDPRDGRAHALLGMNLLRMGEEGEGLDALREAFRRDRFNVRVFNLLNLFEETIAREYEVVEAAPFVFRFHRDERALLERYVPDTLRGAYRGMVRRYGFTPEGPLRYELYADAQHFSVRTTGLPNVGVQGVCFGKVVTALSPAGGPFNWGQITWHELAHVFHIQLSRNHVPRWFTEGLAEYESLLARPEWRRELDHVLHQALVNDRLPPLALLNRAFTRARSAEEMMVAYYASSQVVKRIAERFGFEAIVRMLRAWGRGRTTPEVVREALGVTLEELDRDFREHTLARLAARARDFAVDFALYRDLEAARAAVAAAPDDAGALAALAAALLVHREPEESEASARRALEREADQPVARFVLAHLALAREQAPAARAELERLLATGHDGYEVRLLLAHAAFLARDRAAARAALEAAAGIDPDRLDAWQGLAQVAEEAGDAALRLRAALAVARIDEHDREANALALRLLAEAGRWPEVVTFGEMARLLDPARAESHRMLAEGYRRTGRPREALFEYDSALLVVPGTGNPGPIHLGRAEALRALGRHAEARQAAEQAVAADPSLRDAARSLLGS